MYQNVTLLGRLGNDPELKFTTASNKAVCKFSLATSSGYGDKQKTEWHNIVVWDKRAETCAKYLAKGSIVTVVGEIRYTSWEKDGQKHYKTEIHASDIIFVNKTNENKKSEGGDNFDIDAYPF